eukprot:m.260205 g.260205  ORF g.260205 m.260205 type:complete len:130 (+) comp39426_c0_seq1:228-617(+)
MEKDKADKAGVAVPAGFEPVVDYEKPACLALMDKWRACSSLKGNMRSMWIYGTTRDCEQEWSTLKNCFWLRTLSSENAEVEEYKFKANDIEENPPPVSVRGTIWPPRDSPPAGWSTPGVYSPSDVHESK